MEGFAEVLLLESSIRQRGWATELSTGMMVEMLSSARSSWGSTEVPSPCTVGAKNPEAELEWRGALVVEGSQWYQRN